MSLIKLTLKEKIEILSTLHHRVEHESPLFMDTASMDERVRVHLLSVIDCQLEFAHDLVNGRVMGYELAAG